MGFDERRKLVGSVLFFVVALFVTAVLSFAHSFRETVAGGEVTAAEVDAAQTGPLLPEGPRYTPTAADAADLADRTGPVRPGTPLVGLTFDDGPTPLRTPYVLDVLRAKGVRATFFFQGDHAERYPDLVRRTVAEGHVVGLHSYDHAYFPDLSPDEARDQVLRTEDILTPLVGARPTLWRYPFGEPSQAGDAVLADRGLTGGVHWHWESNLAGDFQCPGADALVRYVTTEAVDQSLVLLHDAGDVLNCPGPQWDYLPRAIDAVRDRGLEFGVVAPAARPSTLNAGSRIAVVSG